MEKVRLFFVNALQTNKTKQLITLKQDGPSFYGLIVVINNLNINVMKNV